MMFRILALAVGVVGGAFAANNWPEETEYILGLVEETGSEDHDRDADGSAKDREAETHAVMSLRRHDGFLLPRGAGQPTMKSDWAEQGGPPHAGRSLRLV
jgi:hypothetical protein